MNKQHTSTVWSYFAKLDNTYAKCNICHNNYSYKTTLTNLKKHLSGPHGVVLKQQRRSHDSDPESGGPPSDDPRKFVPETLPSTSRSPDDAVGPQTSPPPPQRRKLASSIRHLSKNATWHAKRKIDNSLLNMFVRDLRPMETVDDTGFREFVKSLNPGYALPDRRTISKELVPALYEQCLTRMMDVASTVDRACLTTDCWTSGGAESFVSVTVHFVNGKFALASILLGCSPFNVAGRATSDLGRQIERIVQPWNLLEKITFAVSDGAAFDVKNALDSLRFENIGCFARALDGVVQSALGAENGLISKVRVIVDHYRRTAAADDKFKEYQTDGGTTEPRKLLRDCTPGWISTFRMIDRTVDLEAAVRATLGLHIGAPEGLDGEEWTVLKELRRVLKPFEEAASVISRDKFMAASLVIVVVNGLIQVCANLSKTHFSPRVLDVIGKLTRGMNDEKHGIGNLAKNATLRRCTFLDPRFKTIPFKNDSNMSTAIKNDIVERIANIIYEVSNAHKPEISFEQSVFASEHDGRTKQRDEFSIWHGIDTDVAKTTSLETSKSKSIVEVQRYLEDPLLNRDCDPLKWWRDHSYNYPHLSVLAKNTLCCLGTAVPCDNIFTKAGLTLNDRRCRLKSQNVNMLLFLNYNYDS